ncbi:hypothetical protein U5B43_10165 [Campylobacter sp. 9BO]|uniref:hypothetical protein n=1 Tax=Campylobacter sp. 9BO TaxID=3424759 RepID=UPI003D33C192
MKFFLLIILFVSQFLCGASKINISVESGKEPKNGILLENTTLFAVGGGVTANIATKELSSIILNQTAQASVKAGLIGGGVDAGIQVGTQIYDQAINNNGYVDLRDIDLNYDSILYSGISTATTIPTLNSSIKSIVYSKNAKENLKNQLKNTKSKAKQDKINKNISKHNKNIFNNTIFQGSSIGTKIIIKDFVIDSETNNE